MIDPHTAKTFWIPAAEAPELSTVLDALKVIGDSPVVLRDYVKSLKHYWKEARIMPSASDRTAVGQVVRFLELRDEDLQGGLVFREYVELEPLATHSRSGMPLTLEHRAFVLNRKLIALTPYWEEGDYGETPVPPMETFRAVVRGCPANFFTVDLAKKRGTEEWSIIELGDGQVSGLPERADVGRFYRALRG